MTHTATGAERMRAIRLGRLAAGRGSPVTACPYNANGTPAERVLALLFVREYQRHAPDPTDYTS